MSNLLPRKDVMSAYTLHAGPVTTTENGASWDGAIHRGSTEVLQVKARPKKPIAVTGPERELAHFTRVASHLLPQSKTAVHDLVMTLAITAETAITAFNRVIMVKDYPGAAELAKNPDLINADALTS